MKKNIACILILIFSVFASQKTRAQCPGVNDFVPPGVTTLNYVSIDTASSKAIISWSVNTSTDTDFYVVFKLISGIWQAVDTVRGATNTSYSSAAAFADTTFDSYRIQAYDCFKNAGLPSSSHKTIYIKSKEDRCKSSNVISWNAYTNWPSLSKYKILVKKNSGKFVALDSVSNGTLTYTHTNIDSKATYQYIIQAVGSSGATALNSFSQKLNYTPNVLKLPDSCKVNYASTIAAGRVEVEFNVAPTADVKEYKLLRASSLTSSYDTVGRIAHNSSASSLAIVDEAAPSSESSSYYKISVVNTCNVEIMQSSNYGRNVLLTGESFVALNNLKWNFYEQWLDFLEINVYRGDSEDNISGSEIRTFNSNVIAYEDDIEKVLYDDGNYCYYVEYVSVSGHKARSNVVCLKQNPTVYMPNAFSPNSPTNYIFKPVGLFIPKTDYRMDIYNRWGVRIASFTDPKQGWDGANALSENYMYRVQYRDGNNDLIKIFGNVMLMR